jgi:uncharacterized protein (DUF1800 family)
MTSEELLRERLAIALRAAFSVSFAASITCGS